MSKIVHFLKESFSYLIVGSIVILAYLRESPVIAYAAILGVGIILADRLIRDLKLKEPVSLDIPAEVKRKIQDIEARVLSMEYEKKARGF